MSSHPVHIEDHENMFHCHDRRLTGDINLQDKLLNILLNRDIDVPGLQASSAANRIEPAIDPVINAGEAPRAGKEQNQ